MMRQARPTVPLARTSFVATVPGWTTFATTPVPCSRRAQPNVCIISASFDWL